MSAPRSPASPFLKNAELADLLQRAERGDPAAAPLLTEYLDTHPAVWREVGDLGRQASEAWTTLAVGSDPYLGESIRRRREEVEAAAAGPAPTPLEALLAQRVGLTWLACYYADLLLAKCKAAGVSAARENHLQKSQERAQRQYLAAVKALTAVRKLLPAPAPPTATAGTNDPNEPVPPGATTAAGPVPPVGGLNRQRAVKAGAAKGSRSRLKPVRPSR